MSIKIKSIIASVAAIMMCILMSNSVKAAEVGNEKEDLFKSGKEILYVVLCTQSTEDIEDILKNEYNISEEQIDELVNLALRQHNNCKLASNIYTDDVEVYNKAVINEACIVDNKMKDILGNNYENIKILFEEWWRGLSTQRGVSVCSDKDVMVVYATQYAASRDFEVSLPDQRLKISYPSYTLSIVSYDKGTSVSNVPVGDVGPWNINDNYWDNDRRIFSDLELGLPEAEAAYYDNYNDGCDEYGRIVSNPAGIDLSAEVASMLGFSDVESGWVSIYLNF